MNGLGLNPRPPETRFEMKKANSKPKNDSFFLLGLGPALFVMWQRKTIQKAQVFNFRTN
jgi:hypothetical protein